MEKYVRNANRSSRIRRGRLGRFIELFVQELEGQGYSADSICTKIRILDGFSIWLQEKRHAARDVSLPLINRYLRQRVQCPRHIDRPTLMRLLGILQENGIIPRPPVKLTPAEMLAEQYAGYLAEERALAPRSIMIYKSWARRFLRARFGDAETDFASLHAESVVEFVNLQTTRIGRKACKLMTTALRSLFQFLRYRGYIVQDLAAAVPAVAYWTMATILKGLPYSQVSRLLRSCRRETAAGSRPPELRDHFVDGPPRTTGW